MAIEEWTEYATMLKNRMIERMTKEELYVAEADIARATGDLELLKKLNSNQSAYEHLLEDLEGFRADKSSLLNYRSSHPELVAIPDMRDTFDSALKIYDEAIAELSPQVNELFYLIHGMPNPEEGERR